MLNSRRPYFLVFNGTCQHNNPPPPLSHNFTDTIFWHGPPSLTMQGRLLACNISNKASSVYCGRETRVHVMYKPTGVSSCN